MVVKKVLSDFIRSARSSISDEIIMGALISKYINDKSKKTNPDIPMIFA
jgi:hypothetical protein